MKKINEQIMKNGSALTRVSQSLAPKLIWESWGLKLGVFLGISGEKELYRAQGMTVSQVEHKMCTATLSAHSVGRIWRLLQL